MIYADIIIDISSDKLDRSFQYRVPERLEKKIKAGMVAAIPFGNAGRVRKGYVIGYRRCQCKTEILVFDTAASETDNHLCYYNFRICRSVHVP